MGKQLKTADILGALADEKPEATKDKKKASKSASKSLKHETLSERKAIAKEASAGKPSAYEADLRQKLRDKTQLNFGGIPQFVRDEYERLAEKNGMKMREYLYHLLRQEGADIPPYSEMDGRRL